MQRFLPIVVTVSLLLGALLSLPLFIGIWLPDVIYAARHTLAEQKLPSGHSFRVIQYWNRADFYNTELLHTSPNGVVETYLLDGDDDKSWSVPLVVDEQGKTVEVTLSGGRVKRVDW